MGRPRKWANNAERLAAYRAKRAESVRIEPVSAQNTPINDQDVRIGWADFVRFKHQPHVPLSLFDGAGRGSPRRHADGLSYVLVARHTGSVDPESPELGIVTATDHRRRLNQCCPHGFYGWACHVC